MPLTTSKLRSFTDKEAQQAPIEAGAYELLYRGTVVYIGSSKSSIQSRIREHRKRKAFMKVTHFRYRKVEWEEDALELEATLCRTFKKANGGKKPRQQIRTPINRSIFDW